MHQMSLQQKCNDAPVLSFSVQHKQYSHIQYCSSKYLHIKYFGHTIFAQILLFEIIVNDKIGA